MSKQKEIKIKDAFGIVAKVGDTIAYAQPGAGAKAFSTAVITRLSPKMVVFEDGTAHWNWENDNEEPVMNERYRVEGSFVIQQNQLLLVWEGIKQLTANVDVDLDKALTEQTEE